MRPTLIVGLALASLIVLGLLWLYTPDKSRAGLEATYAAPPSSFLQVAGIRLHVRDTGPRDAPAVIFLHGFGASLHTWDDWTRGLEADHRVVRFDLPGFGLTGPDPTGSYTDARAIDILLALMDRLGLARASVVGHSMGGRIAWTFAALHPDRVEKLVLMAPDGFASLGRTYGAKDDVPLMLRLLPYVMPTPLLRAALAPAYGDKAALTDERLAVYRDMMLAPGVRRAIVARTAQQVLAEPEPLLRRIRAPVLLVWGDRDAMIPVSNAADYQRALPQAQLHRFPGLGHIPQEEAPAESLTVLRAFLDRQAAQAAQ